ALGRRPEEVADLHWLADAYLRIGMDHLAEVHYRQLLARDPDDGAARRGLAELVLRHRERLLPAHDDAIGEGS
ncbi:MAG: tetratricopeptide repeat protein, partial [Thermoanaerobaculia bacterium]